MPHRRLDQFQVERAAFADDDVIGIVIDDGVAVLVQGGQQAAFADDEGGAARLLLGQEAGRRHGAGEDVLLLHLDAHASQLGHHVAARALAVVGQQAEGNVALPQLSDEVVRAGNQFRAPVQHAVHVDQIAVLHRSF